MALSDENIEKIREEISQTVLDFVRNPENKDKVLLLKSPQGTGKTITTLKTLLTNEDILTVFLSYGHKHLNDILSNDVLKELDLFHLWGRDQVDVDGIKFCVNPLCNVLINYRINIRKFLCNSKRCGNFESCKYIKQYESLDIDVQSWGGVHSHLNTKYLYKYLETRGKKFANKCLVIDENPISSLCSTIEFSKEDLESLIQGLMSAEIKAKQKENINKDKCKKWFTIIIGAIGNLEKIIDKTDDKGIGGIDFIKKFVEGLKEHSTTVEELKNTLDDEQSIEYIESYNDVLYEIFSQRQKKRYLKDILDDVLSIFKKCIFHYENNNGMDINLPFYSVQENRVIGGKNFTTKFIVSAKVNKELPEKPVIILDATGDKELYSQIFGREIIEYSPEVKIKRYIVQFTDGKYNASSLFKESTRNRVYNSVLKIVTHHHNKGDGMVNIVTLKKFATKNDEKGKYIGYSIERFLADNKVDMDNIRIRHYGDVKGKNEMQNDKVLILVGTPEPNINAFPKEIECWYEGEEKIDSTRVKEPKGSKYHDYRYKDPRYFAHIRRVREHEIEQDIERLRFPLSSDDKVVYVFSELPIRYETNKTTINGFFTTEGMVKLIAEYHVLKTIDDGRGKVSHQTISDNCRHKKPVKDAGSISKVIEGLLKKEAIKQVGLREKRVYIFTEKGKYYYNHLKEYMI